MPPRPSARDIASADIIAVEVRTGTPDLQRVVGTLRLVRILGFHTLLDSVSRTSGLIKISRRDESAGTFHRQIKPVAHFGQQIRIADPSRYAFTHLFQAIQLYRVPIDLPEAIL